MRQILFIAWNDALFQLRQGSTLLWLLVMPPIFFYFIGTVTGGFSSGFGGGAATPIVVVAESPGFLQRPDQPSPDGKRLCPGVGNGCRCRGR